jgi:hypothetical protein
VKTNVNLDLSPRLVFIMEADCVVSEARTEGEETTSVIEKDCVSSVAVVKLEHRLTRIVYCKRRLFTFKRFGL